MRTSNTVKLIDYEINKIKEKIRKTENNGIFRHESSNETLRNLEEIRELLVLVLGG